jgi:hypothetical protein
MGLFDVDENAPTQSGGLLGGGLPAAFSAASVVIKAPPGTTLASIPAPYEPIGQDDLTEREEQDLHACKAGMDNLHNAFWIAGKSLETMKTANLTRQEHSNFAEYVWINWEVSDTQMYRLMDEWRVGEALANLGHKPLESQVRMLTDIRRQTNDKIAITVYDTIARCVPRVTAKIVEGVVSKLPPLPKDLQASEAGRLVRQALQPLPTEQPDAPNPDDVPDITSIGEYSPIGESGPQPSNGKGDPATAANDIARLTTALASLREAAKKVNKAATRRAVEADPDQAAPLIEAIGAALQQIDRAVAVRLPKQD